MKELIDIINEDSQKLKNRRTLINSIRDYCDNNNWNEFIATFKDKGEILVCGQITSYQGHPQIKAGNNSIIVAPEKTMRGGTAVYRYSCE